MARARRLLVVSYYFPPYSSMAAIRLGKLAKHFIQRGWEVRAISARGHERQMHTLEIPTECVVHTPWTEVERITDLIVPRWLKSRPPGATPPSGAAPAAAPARHQFNLRDRLRDLFFEMVCWPDRRMGWIPHAVKAGDALLAEWKPDLIYASAPPATSLVIADKLARRHDVPWVAEFRDLWADDMHHGTSWLRLAIEKIWQRRLLARAAGVVTVSQPWFDMLASRYRRPTAMIMNGTVPEDMPPDTPTAPSRDGPLRITYTGFIYTGDRDPTPLFQAIRLLGDGASEVQVEFYGPNSEVVLPLARAAGAEAQVKALPSVPYREALQVQVHADILLHLQWNDPREAGTISGKLFEYIGAMRPILGLGYDAGSVAQILREAEAGVVCNDPAGIAEHLRRWIAQKRSGGIPPIGSAAAAGLTRTRQYEKLEAFLLGLPVLRAGAD